MLKVYETNTTQDTIKVLINQNITIAWNATATQFCDGIKSFSWYNGYTYGTTCTLVAKDSAGLVTTDPTKSVAFTWRVTIPKYRAPALKLHVFQPTYSAGAGTFKQTNIQDHSAPLSGTFTISIGGAQIKMVDPSTYKRTVEAIPFDVSSTTLRDAIRTIVGLENI
jgi:hypothetical protein